MPDCWYAFVPQVGCIQNFLKPMSRNEKHQNRCAMQTNAYERRPDAYRMQTWRRRITPRSSGRHESKSPPERRAGGRKQKVSDQKLVPCQITKSGSR